MNALPNITIPRNNPLTQAALKLATAFWYSGSLMERSMLFGVKIADIPELTTAEAEIVVTVAVRPITSNRRGIVYAGMIGE